VADFAVAEGDVIRIDIAGTSIGTVADLPALVGADAAGALVLTVGSATLTLNGIAAGDAAAVSVELVSGGQVTQTGTLGGVATSSATFAFTAWEAPGDDDPTPSGEPPPYYYDL